jgi:signal transduction histidine kinase
LTAPLDVGGAEVEFSGSTVGVLDPASLLVALLAALVAGTLGAQLGSALARDLRGATRDVRELGTEIAMGGGTRIVRAARFEVVARLGAAIERLAQRFGVFAQAQERAIEARKAAARMRGLFFASVSHDLKSPLNAILGFSALARGGENLTPGQIESLALIERRGHELLALVETILDAARVEAGQLTLVLDRTDVASLLNEAVQKGRDLAADRDVPVVVEVAEGLPPLRVDRVRMPRAIASFVAYALRATEAPSVRVLASHEGKASARIEVEIVARRFNAWRLEAMLDPGRDPGVTEHRGLSLGLRLARAVTELHGGKVEVRRRSPGNGAVSLLLPC